jgi:hypothetical protein
MSNNATRPAKRKHTLVEGGFDSDSGEEREVDMGVIIDGRGRGRLNRTLHVSQTGHKHAQSLPVPPPDSTLSTSAATSQPSGMNTKRNQVC